MEQPNPKKSPNPSDSAKEENASSDVKIPHVGKTLTHQEKPLVHRSTAKAVSPKEHAELVKKAKVEAYNRGMVDAMSRVTKIREGMLEAGAEIVQKHNMGIELSVKELQLLKMIMESVTKVEDRVVGKVKTENEVTHNVNIVNMIAGVDDSEYTIEDAEFDDE